MSSLVVRDINKNAKTKRNLNLNVARELISVVYIKWKNIVSFIMLKHYKYCSIFIHSESKLLELKIPTTSRKYEDAWEKIFRKTSFSIHSSHDISHIFLYPYTSLNLILFVQNHWSKIVLFLQWGLQNGSSNPSIG